MPAPLNSASHVRPAPCRARPARLQRGHRQHQPQRQHLRRCVAPPQDLFALELRFHEARPCHCARRLLPIDTIDSSHPRSCSARHHNPVGHPERSAQLISTTCQNQFDSSSSSHSTQRMGTGCRRPGLPAGLACLAACPWPTCRAPVRARAGVVPLTHSSQSGSAASAPTPPRSPALASSTSFCALPSTHRASGGRA